MANLKKVNKEALKNAVNTQLEKVTEEHQVVIVGARVIKDGRLELEFAQSRKLRNRKASVLALLNKGDARFNSNTRQVVRIWHMITLEGAKEAFGIDFQPIHDAAQGIAEDERIMPMYVIDKFFAEGEEFKLNIRVRETTDVARLPKTMREDIAANNQYANNHKLLSPTGPNNELEPVVDENGNFVYRWNELDYIKEGQDIDDELVQGKLPLSRYNEQLASAKGQTISAPNTVQMAI